MVRSFNLAFESTRVSIPATGRYCLATLMSSNRTKESCLWMTIYIYKGYSMNKENSLNICFFFLENVNCIAGNQFIGNIIWILQKYFFWDYLELQHIKHNAQDLNRVWGSDFCWWIRANLVKFTKLCNVYRKAYFNQKIITNLLNKSLLPWTWKESPWSGKTRTLR